MIDLIGKKRCIMPIKWIFKLAIRQNKFKNDENAKNNNIGIGVDRAMCWCSLVYSIFIHVESPFFILRPHRKISYWLSDLNWRWNDVEKKNEFRLSVCPIYVCELGKHCLCTLMTASDTHNSNNKNDDDDNSFDWSCNCCQTKWRCNLS